MAARSAFSLVSLFLVAGGLLLMFLILLAGAIDHAPVNKFYLLQADTARIPSAPPVSRWSYWNVCGVRDGRTVCGDQGFSQVHPAYPLDPASHRTFDTTVNIPEGFLKDHNSYFLMTRFMFAFMLIALFFGACALLTGLLALCTRLASYLSGFLAMIAMFFQALNAALMTAAYVKGRDAFRKDDRPSDIGNYAFGFEWGAFACFFLATVLFCMGGGARRDTTSTKRRGFGGFRGRRTTSTRSRGSFVPDKEYGS